MFFRSVFSVCKLSTRYQFLVGSSRWTCLERKLSTNSFDPRLRSYLMEAKRKLTDEPLLKESDKNWKDIPHHKKEKLFRLTEQLVQCDEEFQELKSIAAGKIFYYKV